MNTYMMEKEYQLMYYAARRLSKKGEDPMWLIEKTVAYLRFHSILMEQPEYKRLHDKCVELFLVLWNGRKRDLDDDSVMTKSMLLKMLDIFNQPPMERHKMIDRERVDAYLALCQVAWRDHASTAENASMIESSTSVF